MNEFTAWYKKRVKTRWVQGLTRFNGFVIPDAESGTPWVQRAFRQLLNYKANLLQIFDELTKVSCQQ